MTTSILVAAAATSFLVALLHIYVIVGGARAYRTFGACEALARMAERGSWTPALLTSGIAVVFLVFAAYYLSGAGFTPQLPFLKYVMIGTAAIYTLRGALTVLAIRRQVSAFDFYSFPSVIAIGLLHIAAVWLTWPALSTA